jgi:transposase
LTALVSESSAPPSYEELAALVVRQAASLSEQASLIESMRVELAALRRRVDRDSSNSSQPPSKDGLGAKAKAKVDKRAGDQPGEQGPAGSVDKPRRRQGGQPGHRGSGLARVAKPDRSEPVEPVACGGCGGDLSGMAGSVASAVQVFDLPSFALSVTEYLLMRRGCGCGHVTTADLPPGVRGGPACYGPNVTAAATWLASQDVIGIERAADMMSALLAAPVSTGFVSACLARLDAALSAAGFEDELKARLREQDVVGTDETPAPLTDRAMATGEQDCANPHVFTVRTMCTYTGGGADLVWYGAAGTRRKSAISGFGILDEFRGVLVRDDFGGYLSYDRHLAGVQQCVAHLLRYLDDAHDIDPVAQVWTVQVGDALRTAIHTVNTARRNDSGIDPDLIARLRRSYDAGVAVGISTNLSRPWHKGNHPALVLAKRLKRKADQVWLFTQRPDVPPTNNGSEAAIRGFKLAAKIQGCWRSLTTLQRHCRIRSYLVSARNHGSRPIDAIRDALTGQPWMPPRRSTGYALAA